MSTVIDAITYAWTARLSCGKDDLPDSAFLNVFPGEHYRMIAALVNVTLSTQVVEIGTFTGMGTLALRAGLRGAGKIYTYDIIGWRELGVPSHFVQGDFDDGRLEQRIGDLSSEEFFKENFDVLNEADLIFLDAPKNGVFEYKMLQQLSKLDERENRLLVMDDIRFLNMIDLWRSIISPKIDVSSFGHWSGTGLVDLTSGIKLGG